MGNFWEVAFPYCKAQYDLVLLIHQAAYQSNILNNWKEMNMHLQELLRLSHKFDGYDYGLGGKFPLFLLHEGCDNDAYAFVRYSMLWWYSGPSVDPSLLTLHEGTNQGDWIYPKDRGCCFNDFFEIVQISSQSLRK